MIGSGEQKDWLSLLCVFSLEFPSSYVGGRYEGCSSRYRTLVIILLSDEIIQSSKGQNSSMSNFQFDGTDYVEFANNQFIVQIK